MVSVTDSLAIKIEPQKLSKTHCVKNAPI